MRLNCDGVCLLVVCICSLDDVLWFLSSFDFLFKKAVDPLGNAVLEPSPTPTENFQREERPLTNNEERRLEKALLLKQEISDLLQNIAIDNGESFANETPSDLTEAALNWKDCLCPERLSRIKRSLEFHQQKSSFYGRVSKWVTSERRIRRGPQWSVPNF